MAGVTKIAWADESWNPVVGCSVVSPGCTNCYAMKMAGTRLANHPMYAGLTKPSKGGPVWTGEVRLNMPAIDKPLHWKKPRRVFVNSMGDLFHESVSHHWIEKIFTVMALCPQHQFIVLTKRAGRMRDYCDSAHRCGEQWLLNVEGAPIEQWPLPNVILGVSVEDQARADERIPLLLETPAALRCISYEPALGPVDFSPWIEHLDWLIMGGESGTAWRPMDPAWAQEVRNQCAAAGVAFFFKQRGGPKPGGKALLDGRQHRAWPEAR